MIYAKVDVKLRDHIRAQRAGVAMATWTWGLLYVREQETDGVIHAEALERSWCPKEAKAHAATLVLVGLWEKHDEGWRICRYEDKNDTKKVIAENRQRVRERVAQFRRNSHRNGLPSEDVTRYSSVTNETVPGSSSRSSFKSSEEIKSPEEIPSAREAASPPGWFLAAIEVAREAACPVSDEDIPARWLQYQGSAANRNFAPTKAGAQSWLCSTIRGERSRAASEAEELERRRQRDQERDAKFKSRYDKPPGLVEHEIRKKSTPDESRWLREQLAKVAAGGAK